MPKEIKAPKTMSFTTKNIKTPKFIKEGVKRAGSINNTKKSKKSLETQINELYIGIGSPLGQLNVHQVKQIGIYFLLFIAFNLGSMGIQYLTGLDFAQFEWLKQGIIFGLTIVTKKLGQDSSNIFIKK